MAATAELKAKLTQRRRAVGDEETRADGTDEDANVSSPEPRNAKHVTRRRGSKQTPAPFSGVEGTSRRSSLAEAPSVTLEKLKRKAELQTSLRAAERERDLAQQRVAQAEADLKARGTELTNEAEQLAMVAEGLRRELVVAKLEAPPRVQEDQDATSELKRTKATCREMEIRMQSLLKELELQSAEQRRVEEQLQASLASEAAGRLRLEELAASSVQSPKPGRRAAAMRKASENLPILPPADAIFALDDSPDKRLSVHGKDLEFVYDWGLALSTRMPVERALELAQWASAAAAEEDIRPFPSPSSSPALRPVSDAVDQTAWEDDCEQSMAELQEALIVLRSASRRDSVTTRSRGDSHSVDDHAVEEEDRFAGPIADLQRVMERLQPSSLEVADGGLQLSESEAAFQFPSPATPVAAVPSTSPNPAASSEASRSALLVPQFGFGLAHVALRGVFPLGGIGKVVFASGNASDGMASHERSRILESSRDDDID